MQRSSLPTLFHQGKYSCHARSVGVLPDKRLFLAEGGSSGVHLQEVETVAAYLLEHGDIGYGTAFCGQQTLNH